MRKFIQIEGTCSRCNFRMYLFLGFHSVSFPMKLTVCTVNGMFHFHTVTNYLRYSSVQPR
jgi:hypothetical protein